MDHQVQNLVLVDNEWVSRQVDVYQIMAQARNSDSRAPEPAPEPIASMPEMGILSRTILASPLFKYICSANIRHKDLTDVALVGETAIELKEIHDYGHLRHVATKADFAGKILTARVFGEPREVTMTRGSSLPKKPNLHRARRSMTGEEEDVLPPEVIVLTLTSRTLMFLWARHSRTGAVTFSQKTLKLPPGKSRLDRFGSFLAIDHKRRAMAVAASESAFILYKTKSMDRWRQELRNGMDTTPVEDERIIPIEGRIQHMEFLSSGSGRDNYHVVLLFIVIHQGRTKITCFDWDCRQDLSKATARTERVLVDSEDHNPSLLIPLTRTLDFLLVLDTHISVYRDVLSGTPARGRVDILEGILPSLLPGDSRHGPRWVAWDKTVRNPEFPKEVFYVAREDGRVMYVERALSGEVETDEAGEWPYRIDTAFACLNVDNSEFSQSYPDVLIAGGNGNDGLVCKVGSWPAEYSYTASYPRAHQLTYVESIASWMPLSDMDVTRLPSLRMSHGRDRSSILVANGASPHGEISELRYGLPSFVDDSFGGMTGCTGLWVIDYGSHAVEIEGRMATQHWATFAITLPPETLVIRIIRTQHESRGEFSGAWEDGSWDKSQLPSDDEPIDDAVIRDVETITACPWSEHFAIQITQSEARILRRPSLQQSDSSVFENNLLLAASRPGFPVVAVTYREAGNTYLETLHISGNGTFTRDSIQDSQRHQLDHDPTCVELLDINGVPYIFVCTFGSRIFMFAVEDGAISLTLEQSLASNSLNETRVLFESAVVLSAGGQQILVCATRSGYLFSSLLQLSHQTALGLEWSSVMMGATSAQIRASATDTSTAFVFCGSDFCRVRCSSAGSSALDIDSIWFTNRANPGYMQSPVTAMYQLPTSMDAQSIGRNLGGFLFAVSGDQLLFSQIDSDKRWPGHEIPHSPHNDCRTIPRKLFTGSKPTNILYLKAFRKMVVSTIEAKEERAPPYGYRSLQSTIQLLNLYDEKPLDEPEVKQEDGYEPTNRLVAAEFQLHHGERVYSMAEWTFVDHKNKKYTLIIVGTGLSGSSGKEAGRRLILSPGKSGSKLQLQKHFQYDHPVYCVAILGNASIISVVGKSLIFDVFDSEAGRMNTRATQDLPSPGSHVTIQGSFIHVSTLQHSHMCYEIVQSVDTGDHQFQQVLTDSRERNCAHHLSIAVPTSYAGSEFPDNVVLVTDRRGASITGLYHPPERRYKNAADTLFEACLPHTVVRLQRGDIRPPWRKAGKSDEGGPTGVLIDDIIGACSDGTVYAFSILSRPARQILRYLQNIIEEKENRSPAKRDTVVGSLRSGAIHDVLMNGASGVQDELIHAHPMNPTTHDRSQAGPRYNHINGDLLLRWMSEDGDVDKLLKDGADPDVARQMVLFAQELWSDETGSETDAIAKVERWLKDVLMPLF